jgi:Flp pilus assembly protein TadD
VDALSRARAGRDLRPSVEGEHVLAWALFKNGRCGEARTHSVRALRLGTEDWGAMLHRSLIESCLGNDEAARAWKDRALAVNGYALAAFGPLAAHRR